MTAKDFDPRLSITDQNLDLDGARIDSRTRGSRDADRRQGHLRGLGH